MNFDKHKLFDQACTCNNNNNNNRNYNKILAPDWPSPAMTLALIGQCTCHSLVIGQYAKSVIF